MSNDSTQPKVFTSQRRIEFCETDAAGIAHFSAFPCYMEQAEHAFWRELGTSVVQPIEDGSHVSWPRVRVECEYRGSAKFEDVLQISMRLLKLGTKSLTFGFEFTRDSLPIARGQMVTVCCRVHVDRPLESINIPNELRKKLAPYV